MEFLKRGHGAVIENYPIGLRISYIGLETIVGAFQK